MASVNAVNLSSTMVCIYLVLIISISSRSIAATADPETYGEVANGLYSTMSAPIIVLFLSNNNESTNSLKEIPPGSGVDTVGTAPGSNTSISIET